jgi:DNA polymerase (family 10)
LDNGKEVDLEILPEDEYGSLLLHFTGSKEHNVHLRSLAQQKGLSLSEHGFLDLKNKKLIKCSDESLVYKTLNLGFIEPELREDRGEIEASQKHLLPDLINPQDIKGDLHIHSKWSDGVSSLSEIMRAAKKQKLEYIAITDHMASIRNNKEFPDNLKKRRDKILQAAEEHNMPALISAEVDIRKDGSLELQDQYLKDFDLVIASVHANFDLEKSEQTARIIKAIENPYVKIIGHPTTRKLNKRPGIELDWQEVFEACKKNKVALEINSQPIRLDLTDSLVFEARKAKVKLVINTDSHSEDELGYIDYGISVARRGWCEKQDILNTLSLKEIKEWLAS